MNQDFHEIDIDRLADYIGGALDGTPEHATVAELISRDEAWRAAYEALSEGMASVTTNLGALGTEPMPADVAERLDRAFSKPSGPSQVKITVRTRRARRWAVPVAVAAVVLTIAGFGVNYVLGLGRPATNTSSSAGYAGSAENAPKAASGQALAALPPANRILSSGTDYRSLSGTFSSRGQAPSAEADGAARVPAPLDRLRPPGTLLACLNAIAVENAAGPITVQSVDYARYAGAPAIVVRFTAGNGSWVWASGPECGASGVGASRLDAAKVG